MGILNRKSPAVELLEALIAIVEEARGRSRRSGRPAKVALLTAGGFAGLTAASAGISALRRRDEEAGGDS